MNKIITIVKKELKRYFTDKRTLVSLFLPGLLIFMIYSIMGNIITSKLDDSGHLYQVEAINMPASYENMYEGSDMNVKIRKSGKTLDDSIEDLKNGVIDLVIVYPEDFEAKVNNGEKPNVSVYFSSTSDTSLVVYNYTLTALSETAMEINFKFFINGDINGAYDVGVTSEEDSSKMFIQMMMPFLLIIFLFSGCMAISTEAIAGEKERGTIYTLLVTPTKRSEIAIGKILALSIVSLVSASVSFLGTILSLPKLMGGETSILLSIYGFMDYLAIFLIILVTVILFTSVLLLISAYAKSIKEAGQLALVLMIPTMLVGVTSMLGANDKIWASFIPIYNSITSMSQVFAGNINIVNFLLTIVTNLVIISLVIFLLTKMFNSEKIMRSN